MAVAGGLGLALSFAAVAGLPFFSEAHNHLRVGADMRTWWAAFDPTRVPLRPLQFLPFQLLARMEEPSPVPVRALAYLLHAGSAWMVARLARRFGAGATGGALAAAVFLCAPNVKSLAWTAAIASPGRVFCLLAALVLLGDPRRRPAGGALGVLALLAGLCFHQSAVVLAPLLVLLAWTAPRARPVGAGGLPFGARPSLWLLLRPAVLVALAAVLAYLVYVGLVRTERGHELRGPAGLPANLVKAAFALAPEGLRVLAVDGFRGRWGGPGVALAGALGLALAAGFTRLAVRGAPATRFALLGVAVDAVLPVLTTGYGQRYSYLGSALLAVACGCAVEAALRRPAPRRVLAGVALLSGLWLADQVRDTRELREAGRAHERVLDGLALERRSHEERVRDLPGVQAPIVLVDFPDVWGRERDLPLFNWGLDLALERRGIPGPWVLLRTRSFATSSTFQPVSPEELERLLAAPRVRVLAFDPVRLEPVPWVELRAPEPRATGSAQAGG